MNSEFFIEIVWNREFNWMKYGRSFTDLDEAIAEAKLLENMGDGESVKKTRISDDEGRIRWAYGKKIELKDDTKEKTC